MHTSHWSGASIDPLGEALSRLRRADKSLSAAIPAGRQQNVLQLLIEAQASLQKTIFLLRKALAATALGNRPEPKGFVFRR
jgi:hypothetical protein